MTRYIVGMMNDPFHHS